VALIVGEIANNLQQSGLQIETVLDAFTQELEVFSNDFYFLFFSFV
jgi:hypothetical protein